MKKALERRIASLEGESCDGTPTGIVEVEPEETARWWQSWDGSPAQRTGPGLALVSPEMSAEKWVERFGSIEHDVDPEEQSNV